MEREKNVEQLENSVKQESFRWLSTEIYKLQKITFFAYCRPGWVSHCGTKMSNHIFYLEFEDIQYEVYTVNRLDYI